MGYCSMTPEEEAIELEKMAKRKAENDKEEEARKLRWREIYGSDDRWNRFNELCEDMHKRIAKRVAEQEKREAELEAKKRK